VRASKTLLAVLPATSLVVPALLMAGATPAYATPANDAFAAAQTINRAKQTAIRGVVLGTRNALAGSLARR
jgi:hypothetical protein